MWGGGFAAFSLHILFVLIRVIKAGLPVSFSLLVVTTVCAIQVKRNVETKEIWHYHWFAPLVVVSSLYTRDKEMWLKIAINQLWGRCLSLAIYSLPTLFHFESQVHSQHSFIICACSNCTFPSILTFFSFLKWGMYTLKCRVAVSPQFLWRVEVGSFFLSF